MQRVDTGAASSSQHLAVGADLLLLLLGLLVLLLLLGKLPMLVQRLEEWWGSPGLPLWERRADGPALPLSLVLPPLLLLLQPLLRGMRWRKGMGRTLPLLVLPLMPPPLMLSSLGFALPGATRARASGVSLPLWPTTLRPTPLRPLRGGRMKTSKIMPVWAVPSSSSSS